MCIPAGTYRETVTISKPLTLVGHGAVIDGDNTRQFAIRALAADVTIEGFEVTDHRPPYQRGAIESFMVQRTVIRDVYVHDNPRPGAYATDVGGGISFSGGGGHVIEDSRIEANDIAGVTANGYGYGTTSGIDGLRVSRTTIAGNNPSGQRLGWHSGGIKATKVRGWVIEDSIVTDNRGSGIWCDIDCVGATIVRNRVGDNSWEGIFYEISTGALIADNAVWRNGWDAFTRRQWCYAANILVSSSDKAEVRDNVVAWGPRGITVLSQDRNYYEPHDGNNVHDNVVVSDRGDYIAGFCDDHGGTLFASGNANRGSGNRYWAPAEPSTNRFQWSGGRSTLGDYNGTPGEEGGTYLSTAERDALLTDAGIPTSR